ncbi:type IX secretion system protein PorG [Pontibacter beigongshangensis]|uniref:type IX secretion system protein PorG n=1 Tax=Pontibacter beigongshangensis TaxID=2574733 RepID=UPI0016507B0E|nr:DUF6089 family protein [Pontibacter beigongshangensis]
MTLSNIKHTLLICLLVQVGSVFFSETARAQRYITTSEIGGGIGGVNYKGEIAPSYRLLSNQPAITAFYRRDISAPITLRGGLVASHRIIDDNTFSDESFNLPLAHYRQAELRFSLLELSAVMEYNFLDYYDFDQPIRISPYFFAGVAGFLYNQKTTFGNPDLRSQEDPFRTTLGVAIPVGVGIKYALSRHWNLGLEFGARKLLSDNIDNLQGQDKRISNPYDNDWYFYNGVSLSYTFYRINCPPVYKNKPGLLD